MNSLIHSHTTKLTATFTVFLLFSTLNLPAVFGENRKLVEHNTSNYYRSNNNNSSNNKEPKCFDGKLPLLDENRALFPCQRGCPSTFFCEIQPTVSLCCPNATEIEQSNGHVTTRETRDEKAIGFQLESSAELERSMSCERFPYKASCENSTDSQPQAKWYFDLQSLSCEMYPLGMCEDVDPLEKLALRTREDCEQRCDVAKLKTALEKLSDGNSVEQQPLPVFHRLPQVPQIAIDDVVQESKHIRGRPFAVEPPTDLLHVIHVPSDAQFIQKRRRSQKKQDEIDENQLLTTDSSDDVPTVTSDILTVLEDANDDVEGSGSTSSELREERVLSNERHQRKKSLKSMEDSFERFYQSNRESVSCSQTAYRLLCSTGAPSQFVYRWERVNGVCQSFPYGYCWHENNVPHPRTRAECEQFCD